MELNNIEGAATKSWSGFWSGIIWFILGFITISITQLVTVIFVVAIEAAETGEKISGSRINELFSNGDVVATSFVILFPIMLALLAFAIKVRRKKPFLEYLAVKKVKISTLLLWVLAAFTLLAMDETVNYIVSRPAPEWVATAYQTSQNYLLLISGMVIFGPITEELLFRGYLFKTWSESRIGPYASIVLISLLWAGIHLQYDLYEMSMIFTLGLLLCWARFKTGSIFTSMTLHIFWNLISLIQIGQTVYN